MTPHLWFFDEMNDFAQALNDLCVACMGRGCTNCLPADWQGALDHADRTPPLMPDRIHALNREPIPAATLTAADCDPIHPPGWLIGAAAVIDERQEAAEVLRILTAARKDPP